MSGYKISLGREAGTKRSTFMGDHANDVTSYPRSYGKPESVVPAHRLRDDERLSQRRGCGDGQK